MEMLMKSHVLVLILVIEPLVLNSYLSPKYVMLFCYVVFNVLGNVVH